MIELPNVCETAPILYDDSSVLSAYEAFAAEPLHHPVHVHGRQAERVGEILPAHIETEVLSGRKTTNLHPQPSLAKDVRQLRAGISPS